MIPFSGKIQNAVHQMLYDFRPRQFAALGDMGDDEDRNVIAFSHLHQQISAGPDLGNAAGYRIKFLSIHGLNRIDDKKSRPDLFAGGNDIFYVRLRQHQQRIAHLRADTVCPHFNLFL